MIDPVLCFWGKARPSQPNGPRWHPLVWHLLDVAATGEALFALQPRRLWRLARMLDVDPDFLRRQLPCFLAVHDLGKCAAYFQTFAPELYRDTMHTWETWAVLLGAPAQPRHDTLGFALYRSKVVAPVIRMSSPRPTVPDALASAIFGHHGAPPHDDHIDIDVAFPPPCLRAAKTIAATMAELFLGDLAPVPLSRERIIRASHEIAGFATLADWIGSNQAWFPYTAPDRSPAAYLAEVARPRARAAVAHAGLAERRAGPVLGFAALTGRADPPSALQATCETLDLPLGPLLILVEDVTGAGKTEAGLLLANRLIARGDASGLYVALPTMATANAMFGRVKALYRRLFAASERPSLALAHGRAEQSDAFQAIVALSTADPREDDLDTGGAECAAFFADDRRAALHADVGVGTIDQALLAALKVKHQPVRLAGLADKVLLVDEVHSVDAYMGRTLETLLTLRAAAGASTILMSATLPAELRRRFEAAHAAGMGETARAGTAAAPYPALTVIAPSAPATILAVESPARLRRRVDVAFLGSGAELLDRVADAHAAGAATCVIRNTVTDAIATFEALRARGVACDLFHARFALGDRFAKEASVLDRFGPPDRSDGSRRGASVLVATQVVEQSLDIDFDVLVTDLAPIDLLIQRAGRLRRHARAHRPIDRSELLVLAPSAHADADESWLNTTARGTRFVYPDLARLWMTAKLLEERGGFSVPDDLRGLVDGVYRENIDALVPPGLLPAALKAQGLRRGDESHAMVAAIDPASGYVPGSGWLPDEKVGSRLGEPTLTLGLCHRADGRLRPLIAHDDPRRAWALSEVSIRAALFALPPPARQADIDTLARIWPLVPGRALAIIDENGVIEGLASRRGDTVRYHSEWGLMVERS